jgi:hypothetical protein
MATYKVTRVRKEASSLRPSHEHIVGVVTDDGAYHTVPEVVASITVGDLWETSVPGERDVPIVVEEHCPGDWCMLRPYLSSTGDSLASSLEKLPRG